VRRAFDTQAGTIEVVIDEASRTIGIYRFDAHHRTIAATMESWDHVDLAEVLVGKLGVLPAEAQDIAVEVSALGAGLRATRPPDLLAELRRSDAASRLDPAGVALRFVAVLLDAIVVLFPLSIVVGLLTGGGYSERANGYVNVGVDVGGKAFVLWLALALGYYVLSEALTGKTLGKRLVGIRVVDEEGDAPDLAAAMIRNVLRLIDGLFFYLVGALFALKSDRGQRLGDRAAHTVVVRS
jgi:uncharacterized RDD family membrane protein YckC